jgi:hypothetical protein
MDPWSAPISVLRSKIMMDFLHLAIVYPNRMTATNLAFSRWKILLIHTSKFSPAAFGPVQNCRPFLNDYCRSICLWKVGHCAKERNGKMIRQWIILYHAYDERRRRRRRRSTKCFGRDPQFLPRMLATSRQ